MGPVTLLDVAKIAGVSMMTVSRALRGVGRIREETRAKVLQAADLLGYMPNAAAQATATGRFNNIALLLSTVHGCSTLSGETLRGIEDELVTRRISLTVSMLPDAQLVQTWGMPQALVQTMTDGLLVNYTHQIPPELMERIEANHLPSVWINSKRPLGSVYPDDARASHMLTRHLLGMGHRRIAYLDFSHDWHGGEEMHYSAVDRRGGYELAMREAALPAVLALPHWTADLQAERWRCARELLSGPERPTAVVCYSSRNAMTLGVVAAQMGLVIPADLSVATFDIQPQDLLGPVLTAALSPDQKLGSRATAMLLEMIATKTVDMESVAVPFTLFEGQSCMPPK